jgi:serine kinase of HPr protein (carbohydrate metabolism regulator)
MPEPLSATDHVINLLRACGPSTLSQIALELFEQCEGVNTSNDKVTAFHAVARLVHDDLVTVEQDGNALVFDLTHAGVPHA